MGISSKNAAIKRLGRERLTIIVLWFAFFLANLFLLFYLDWTQYSPIDTAPAGFHEPIRKAYGDLIAMYTAPFATMLAVAFARKPAAERLNRSHIAFIVAIVFSSIWNISMLAQICRVSVFHSTDIQSTLDFLPVMPGRLSFLMTPGLAFYFASENE